MCGIAGIAGEEEQIAKKLMLMTQSQIHRGNDFEDLWTDLFLDAGIGLSHNRQKTLDMLDESNQPFSDEDTGLVVIVDGEIYNYPELHQELSRHYNFRTKGMIEVISKAYHRWGEKCLRRFNGIFAIAIYDRTARHLFLARDRFGIKPLYYAFQRGNFYFASEIRALFAAGIKHKASAERWAGYFVYSSYGSPGETFWDGIFQLPGGCAIYYNGYSIRESRWYSFGDEVEKVQMPNDRRKISEHYLELIDESIHENIQAGVPIGFCMSGKIDSAILLSSMFRHGKGYPFKVFSYYHGSLAGSDILWIEEMLAGTPFRLDRVKLTPRQAVNEAIHIAHCQEEPFDGLDSLAWSYMMRTTRRKGVGVLCDSLGLEDVWQCDWMNSGLRFDVLEDSGVLDPEFRKLARKPVYPHYFSDENRNLRYSDLFQERIPHILRFHDKISSAYTVLLRRPFLNHKLLEFSFAIPSEYKRDLNAKRSSLVADMAHRALPEDVRLAPCRCESVSRQWLKAELKNWAEDLILGLREGQTSYWFNGKRLEQAWHDYNGTLGDDYSAHVWKLLSLRLIMSVV